MNFEVWPEAMELGEMFAAEGFELALVGGPVRDLLLHRRSHDLDFCTSARPEQFEPILRKFGRDGFWDMGRKFGTLGAMRRRADGTEVQVEVTTYRTDAYNPDSRKPEVAYGDTLEGDLSRRDFTVNAMALRVPELEFVDPFGGANDLAKGVLRTPVDPRQSFDDDPLRMMRAVRFVAQLGFSIEPETAEAMYDMTDRIRIVSAERVRDELVKTLLSDRPRAGIEALVESGLADIVFPEIPALELQIDGQVHGAAPILHIAEFDPRLPAIPPTDWIKTPSHMPLRRQNHPASGIIRTLASQPAVIPAHARKQRRHPSALKSPSPLSARKTDSCFGEHEPGRHLFQRLGNHSAEAPPPSPITPNHPPTRAGTTSYPQPAIRLSEGSLRKIASNHESLSSSRPTA